MAQAWTSAEAFENDLFAFSEIEGVQKNFETSIPQSLIDWEARNNIHHRSVFDTPDLSEDVTYIFSGRGRGGVSTIIRPGAPTKITPNIDEDIKKKIREVSGAGFSNELIQQTFRPSYNNTITGTLSSKIALQPSTSRSNTSINSTNTRTNSSGASTPSVSPKKSLMTNSSISLCSSRNSTPSEPEPEPEPVVESACANPLPLSAILKNAKKDFKRKVLEKPKTPENKINESKENREENVDMNDVWWSGSSNGDEVLNSWRSRDGNIANRFFNSSGNNKDCFNISSSKEFPTLK